MGLHDRPIVDTAAENSAQSVLALRAQFQEKNGFIPREDIPDKGCDFMVEVIQDHKATNWRFPIQLKSITKPTIIDNGKTISYSFKLSRLGYLLEHKPLVGMVVFYSLEDGKLYYDYVEQIYHRLKDRFPDCNWMEMDSTNIYIPVANVLDESTRLHIHSQMVQSFTNHAAMYKDHAGGYQLPVIEPAHKKPPAGDMAQKAEKVLRQSGMSLLQESEIQLLYSLLGALPNQVVTNDPYLALLAALTYTEIGYYVDSEYYLTKVISKSNLTDHQRLSADWTKVKNDYHLNKISHDQYLTSVLDLRNRIPEDEKQNLILLDLNISRHKILGISPYESIPPELIDSFFQLETAINNLESDMDNKGFLHILNAENLSLLTQRLHDILLLYLNETTSGGQSATEEEKKIVASHFISFGRKFTDIFSKVMAIAKEVGNELLQAEALAVFSHNSLAIEFALLNSKRGMEGYTKEQRRVKLANDINKTLTAVNLYMKKGYLERAYKSLCNAIELYYIARHYELGVDLDLTELNDKRKQLQGDLQSPDYEFQSLKLIDLFHSKKKTSTALRNRSFIIEKMIRLFKWPWA